jgi:hypothetical protein
MLIAKYVAINLPVGTVAAFPGINLKGLLSGRKPASLTQIQTETLPKTSARWGLDPERCFSRQKIEVFFASFCSQKEALYSPRISVSTRMMPPLSVIS